MAIHTDTVLVVALVGSLGYYLFFYQDDPKVGREDRENPDERGKATSPARCINRTCATHFSGAGRKNWAEGLSGLRQDFINLRRSSAASSQGI